MDDLYLKQLEVGPMENFQYLVASRQSREAAVVDPAWDLAPILRQAEAEGFQIKHALITHHHFDHTNKLKELVEQHDVTAWVHRQELDWLRWKSPNLRATEGGQTLSLGPLEIRFIHTPGHTPGSQCFLLQDRLIAGDTLFIGACGRCDLPGGDPEAMYRSLTGTLRKMDPQTILLPGHNYANIPSDTLAEEMRHNPYLGAGSLEQFLSLMGIGVPSDRLSKDSS